MEEKLLKIINIILEKNNKELISVLRPDYSLRNDLGFDSLDLAELTVRIEAEFGKDIFEDGIVYKIGEILEKLSSTNK